MHLAVVLLTVGPVLAWHEAASRAVDDFAEAYSKPGMKVLDVGGRIVNGGAREHFERRGCKFTSLDMEAGLGVDVVRQLSPRTKHLQPAFIFSPHNPPCQ